MNNTEKIRILKAMRELIETNTHNYLCCAYARVMKRDGSRDVTISMLNEIGLFKPDTIWDTGVNIWFHPNDKQIRLQKIDEAIAKWELELKQTTMNKEQIKSKMQSIEESIKEQTNELNKLRAEMDKPEKPTLEEMCKGKGTYWLDVNGEVCTSSGYDSTNYLSRERAEKEKLRIKLSVIADYFNGGLFEPKDGERGYYICVNRRNNTADISNAVLSSSGEIYFKTREHAELAMTTYFTNDELIKMLR